MDATEGDPQATTLESDRSASEASSGATSRELELSRLLIEIWSEVLETDDLSVEDNFFQLGGTSLDAMEIVTRIKKSLGIIVFVTAIFEAPTIREFVAAIGEKITWSEFEH
jgi:acyl carrier protein